MLFKLFVFSNKFLYVLIQILIASFVEMLVCFQARDSAPNPTQDLKLIEESYTQNSLYSLFHPSMYTSLIKLSLFLSGKYSFISQLLGRTFFLSWLYPIFNKFHPSFPCHDLKFILWWLIFWWRGKYGVWFTTLLTRLPSLTISQSNIKIPL